MIESLIKKAIAFILILFMVTIAIQVIGMLVNEYYTQNGVTTSAEGTVTEKRHTDAHYEYNGFLFFSSSKYYPEKWLVNIKKYDPQKKEWVHASLDVDKADYDKLSAGDYYKSKNVQTVYFWCGKAKNNW